LVKPPSTARPLILLVEDDRRSARGLARMLTDDGFDVECALDGAAAIARLSRSPLPDALITDFFMPHADGLTVAGFARSRSPSIPAIVVTGHAELMAAAPATTVPTPIVLVKPLDYDVLTQTLRRLLAAAA
jgi:two-component system response regulator MprA